MPLIPFQLPKNTEGITLRCLVKIWQIGARQCEHQLLGQSIVDVQLIELVVRDLVGAHGAAVQLGRSSVLLVCRFRAGEAHL